MKRTLLLALFVMVGLLIVACQPQVVEVEKIVEVEKEVEVEVTREVEVEVVEEVVVEVEKEVEKIVEVEVGSSARGAGDRLTAILWQAPSN